MPMFDTYLMVDWSARAAPSPKKTSPDAIWWATLSRKGSNYTEDIQYARTRFNAIARIRRALVDAADAGRRVLVGFDFAFGYPHGFAERITGKPCAFSLWRRLAGDDDGPDKTTIMDNHLNENNRFAVAAQLNRMVAKDKDKKTSKRGPFWGFPLTRDQQSLSVSAPDPYPRGDADETDKWPEDLLGFKRFRETDRLASGAKPVWQLLGNGSVGSQVLVGLPWLHELRRSLCGRAVVWPFETGFSSPPPSKSVVIVEIYPSLLKEEVDEVLSRDKKTIAPCLDTKGKWIPDCVQVLACSGAFAGLDGKPSGSLAHLFKPPAIEQLPRVRVKEEEGWIFGVGVKNEVESEVKEAAKKFLASR